MLILAVIIKVTSINFFISLTCRSCTIFPVLTFKLTVCPVELCPKRPVVPPAPKPVPKPVDVVLDVGVPNNPPVF